MIKGSAKEQIVLVCVVKNRRDLNILLAEHWYRIPVAQAPKLRPGYLAFYQPSLFGYQGKRIQHYARILNYKNVKRSDLLPGELSHPRAHDDYFQVRIGRVHKLPRPVRNIIPRRVSFGFTTLNRLLKSKNILQLYNVNPTEEMMGRGLKRAGIRATGQYYVLGGKKRYCLDFAIFCQRGKIAIECDNKKAHSARFQKEKDKAKDIFLKERGWTVIRLSEHDIIFDLNGCIARVKTVVQKLGGIGAVDS